MEESFDELEESLISIIDEDLEDSLQEESYEELVDDILKLCSNSPKNSDQEKLKPKKQGVETDNDCKLGKEVNDFLMEFPTDCHRGISFQYFSSWLMENYPVLGPQKTSCQQISSNMIEHFLSHLQSCGDCKERNMIHLSIKNIEGMCSAEDTVDPGCLTKAINEILSEEKATNWDELKLNEFNGKLINNNYMYDNNIFGDNSFSKRVDFKKLNNINNRKRVRNDNENVDLSQKCPKLEINSPCSNKKIEKKCSVIGMPSVLSSEENKKLENSASDNSQIPSNCFAATKKDLKNNIRQCCYDGEFKIPFLPNAFPLKLSNKLEIGYKKTTKIAPSMKTSIQALATECQTPFQQKIKKINNNQKYIDEIDQQLKIINNCLETITETNSFSDHSKNTNITFNKSLGDLDNNSELISSPEFENSIINNLINEELELKDHLLLENYDANSLNAAKSQITIENNSNEKLILESKYTNPKLNKMVSEELVLKEPTVVSDEITELPEFNEVIREMSDYRNKLEISKSIEDSDKFILKKYETLELKETSVSQELLQEKLEIFEASENCGKPELLKDSENEADEEESEENKVRELGREKCDLKITNCVANELMTGNSNFKADNDSFILEVFVDELLDKKPEILIQNKINKNSVNKSPNYENEAGNSKLSTSENDTLSVDHHDDKVVEVIHNNMTFVDKFPPNDINVDKISSTDNDVASSIPLNDIFSKDICSKIHQKVLKDNRECMNETSDTEFVLDIDAELSSNLLSTDTQQLQRVSHTLVNPTTSVNSPALQQMEDKTSEIKVNFPSSPVPILQSIPEGNETLIDKSKKDNSELTEETFPDVEDTKLEFHNSSKIDPLQVDEVQINFRSEGKNGRYETFISDDPDENKDNNDPEWLFLKKLQSDDERYKAVRQRWKSIVIPDPQSNLTTQNWRKLREEREVVPGRCHKRSATSEAQGQSDPKRYRKSQCTINFDEKINNLEMVMSKERYFLMKEHEEQTKQLSRKHANEAWHLHNELQNSVNNSRSFYEQQFVQEDYKRRRLMMTVTHRQEFLLYQQLHKKRIADALGKLEEDLRKLKSTREEVLAFYKFYSRLKNSSTENEDKTVLSELQIQQLRETEQMYNLYDKYYN